MMQKKISIDMLPQPDATSCGPTCLHALYQYYGDDVSLSQIIREVPSLKGGGTLGVMLANHALKRGYRATIYTYNLMIFDPSWFRPGVNIQSKLIHRMDATTHPKSRKAMGEYIRFIGDGGTILFEDLTRNLLRRFLKSDRPILTGLSSTFLYRAKRVNQETHLDDDIGGEVDGHFVVLSGYHRENKTVRVTDPYSDNPYAGCAYSVPIDRVIGAILLGVMTYDANFLIIEPMSKRKSEER